MSKQIKDVLKYVHSYEARLIVVCTSCVDVICHNFPVSVIPTKIDKEALTTLLLCRKNVRFIQITVIRMPAMIKGYTFIKCPDNKSADEAIDQLRGTISMKQS